MKLVVRHYMNVDLYWWDVSDNNYEWEAAYPEAFNHAADRGDGVVHIVGPTFVNYYFPDGGWLPLCCFGSHQRAPILKPEREVQKQPNCMACLAVVP